MTNVHRLCDNIVRKSSVKFMSREYCIKRGVAVIDFKSNDLKKCVKMLMLFIVDMHLA